MPHMESTDETAEEATNGAATNGSATNGVHNLDLYKLVRVTNLSNDEGNLVAILDQHVRTIPYVVCIQELSDESWELLVRKARLRDLQVQLESFFPGCHIDFIYNPLEPTNAEVSRLGWDTAKVSVRLSLAGRANYVANNSASVAAAYYRALLNRLSQ